MGIRVQGLGCEFKGYLQVIGLSVEGLGVECESASHLAVTVHRPQLCILSTGRACRGRERIVTLVWE